MNIIVIGAGQAGSSLVVKLRNLGFDGAITLIGAEPVAPYQRPPLSKKYLMGEMPLKRLYLRPPEFYAQNDINLILSKTVTTIDPQFKTITMGKETLSYDQLAFTTGSQPRRLPTAIGGDLDGIYTVRNLADVDAMAPEFIAKRHVLIIGGGYIGLEAAAIAASRGLRVTLVEMADRILQRVAAPQTSDYFRALHQAHGVDIKENVGLKTLTGDKRVHRAELSDGTMLEIDFAIVGVGITPASELAEAAGCVIDNGIQTDAQGRTSVANIWAAGDCASFPHNGGRIRLESVSNAIEQAEIVAQNMLGAALDYHAKPWFWSDQYDVKLQIAGLNTGYDNVITRKGDDAVSFWYYLGDKLLAVDAMNDPRAYMIAKRLIESGKTADPTIVVNADADLKTLL